MDLNFKMRAYLMFNNIIYLINSYRVIHFMGQIKKTKNKKNKNKNKPCFSRQDSRWNLQTEIYFIIKRNFDISILHIHVHVNTMYIEYVTAFIKWRILVYFYVIPYFQIFYHLKCTLIWFNFLYMMLHNL